MLARILLLLVMSTMTVLGCAPGPESKNSSVQDKKTLQLAGGGQIIIRFRSPTIEPSNPEILASLSATAERPLVFIRPMSGGAFVLRADGVEDVEQLAGVIRRLGARADVESVEPDRQLYHQSSPNSAK